jgi:hypothetical protein
MMNDREEIYMDTQWNETHPVGDNDGCIRLWVQVAREARNAKNYDWFHTAQFAHLAVLMGAKPDEILARLKVLSEVD